MRGPDWTKVVVLVVGARRYSCQRLGPACLDQLFDHVEQDLGLVMDRARWREFVQVTDTGAVREYKFLISRQLLDYAHTVVPTSLREEEAKRPEGPEPRDLFLERVAEKRFVRTIEEATLRENVQTYDVEGYASMTFDTNRNAAYQSGIAAWSSATNKGKNQHVVEIGPGADAFLTLMLLKSAPKTASLLAIEGNAKSARAARAQLAQSAVPTQVVAALSTDPDIDYGRIAGGADLILHEILGYFASREGVATVLRDLRARLPPNPARVWIPAYFGTFFTPILLTSKRQLGVRGDVAVPVDQPRMVLVNSLKLEPRSSTSPFWPQSAPLEWFDMHHTTAAELDQQAFSATFVSQSDNVRVNALLLFIFIAFDAAKGARGGSRRAAAFRLPAPVPHEPRALVSGITSARTSLREAGVHAAANWPNPVVFFNRELNLNQGDELQIDTAVDLLPLVPTYSFAARLNGQRVDSFAVGGMQPGT